MIKTSHYNAIDEAVRTFFKRKLPQKPKLIDHHPVETTSASPILGLCGEGLHILVYDIIESLGRTLVLDPNITICGIARDMTLEEIQELQPFCEEVYVEYRDKWIQESNK